MEVVKSMQRTIRQNRPFMLVEVLPAYSDDNYPRINRQIELEKVFEDFGYSIFEVKKTVGGVFSGLEYIERLGVHSDLTRCDYLVVPDEKLDELGISKNGLAGKAHESEP